MNDRELDQLFARAREETPDDAGAAERFLTRWRADVAAPPPAPPVPAPWSGKRRPRTWPALLAGAAVLTGALVLRPVPALPASAAYDAYHGTLGEGW